MDAMLATVKAEYRALIAVIALEPSRTVQADLQMEAGNALTAFTDFSKLFAGPKPPLAVLKKCY